MLGLLRTLALAAATCLIAPCQSTDFKPTPEVPAMPKALMKMPRTNITRAKFPAVDFHLHGQSLKTAADYEKMIQLMDQTGIGVICNMDGGFGKTFDRNMQVGAPYKDRMIHFARRDFNGIGTAVISRPTTRDSISLGRCAPNTTSPS